jgi:NitT/TauT family transport system ATP-binding protein
MHEEVLRIHDLKGMTIIFVTHDVEESVVLADRVAVMAPRPGRVREMVNIALARPRDATQPEAVRTIRRLRDLIQEQ